MCRDPRRDRSLVCVVEEASDIGAIERAGEYRGLYHVLGGRLAPLDGVGPEELTVGRARNAGSGRLCPRSHRLATNPSLEGEATALFVQRKLSTFDVAVTRICPGDPGGRGSRICRQRNDRPGNDRPEGDVTGRSTDYVRWEHITALLPLD